MQDWRGAIGAHHFGRTVEAVELEFDAMGRIGIVTPHPLDEFSIRVEPAEAVAESGLLHRLIRCRAATGHVLVHDAPARETALDGNGAVAMHLHQPLEEPVAEDEDVLAAVEASPKPSNSTEPLREATIAMAAAKAEAHRWKTEFDRWQSNRRSWTACSGEKPSVKDQPGPRR